jgi:probable rRNA maturation factor
VLIQMSRWGPASLASGVDLEGLTALLQAGARMLKVDDETVTVLTLTGDEHLREYNRRYRGVDEPTDVLAFAAQEKPSDQRFQAPPGTEHWLGDIVIALPRARRQAREAGHPINDEVRLLAVHGFLHLLGYDHGEPAQETAMTELSDRILRSSP